ncbi:PPR domain-containing protein/PPR_2 domain-containing protein/PPR_3 domain-containing protein/DYW_deaminase domain-containing protein [Heracleum sosnowskyi]|uniref:PPR domain-containing protein/PPR_2 domain-containing protein/PPR_3 domain-containing protein/DYW_deaminase domain-containing protein n=1 Tax=Heracleum sosnowskyi TaxID=360622 RepID=A0AAD8JFG8_9APIA|nr:PPR domain-containing protein/PPR_2 domain-containing protein/PPR_3 domain-containing protein/DYW_deaminase domain-containing protein [Heracleum sosnowskyi]
MPDRNVVSWTTLISGYVNQGWECGGSSLFCEMRREGIRPNEFCFSSVLKGCVMKLDLRFGVQVHGEVIKVGFLGDGFVGSCLVDLYVKCGELGNAGKVFYSMPELNAVLWNVLLNGYAQLGDSRETLRLFCSVNEREMKFNKFTLCTVLKGCVKSGDLTAGQVLHCIAVKIGCESAEFLGCTLVDMYSKCGLVDDALLVFSNLKCDDTVTWSAMIDCLAQNGREYEAAELFCSMKRAGLTPNQYTLASLASAATQLGVLYCKTIHAYVYKYGFESDNVICNAMITMYLGLGLFNDGYRVFNGMRHRDVVSWNSLLSGFHNKGTCDQGNPTCDQGIPIFKQMLVEGYTPSTSTYISTVGLCSSLTEINFGRQVHAYIIKDSLSSDNNIGTALIDMYAKCSCMKDAEGIFNRLYTKDLITWTAIIAGYAHNSQEEKAIACFCQMQTEGYRPNEFTISSCLKACSGIASLVIGRLLHSHAIKSGNLGEVVVASAVVELYGKCGSIEEAELIFSGMDSHDTVAYNTLICEYVNHRQGEKALEAFKNMLDKCVSPDGVTFLGILSACRYMGLVEEGRKIFYAMSEVYRIIPSIKHYACMVDILARLGRHGEVESFIQQMNVPPDASEFRLQCLQL